MANKLIALLGVMFLAGCDNEAKKRKARCEPIADMILNLQDNRATAGNLAVYRSYRADYAYHRCDRIYGNIDNLVAIGIIKHSN